MAKPSRGKSSSAQPAAGPAAKKAKPSSAKKVQRVARAGGRTSGGGGRRNLAYPAIVGTVLVLGVALVVFARSEGEVAAEPPTIADHWHSAYELVQCDTVLPVSVNDADPNGIHTHGDGVMHIHPGAAQQVARAGERATLGVFMEAFGGEITDDSLTLEDGTTFTEGEDDCDGEAAVVQVAHWSSAAGAADTDPEILTEDVADIRFRNDGEAFTIAFAPEGVELGPPATSASLAELGAIDSGGLPSTSPPSTSPPSTSTP